MTEREALLRAVCEDPDDDTPRLVFADWLQENGEPERAEFIRLQCRRASERTSDPLDEWNERISRELRLWNAFGEQWEAELPKCDAPALDWSNFERGFAGEMLRARAAAKLETARIEYEVTDCAALDWERLLWAAPIARLALWNLTNWAVVFDRPEAVRLKSVVLYDCGIDADTIDPLLRWADRTAGHLIVKQDVLAVACGRRLCAAFGDRFEWRRPLDNC